MKILVVDDSRTSLAIISITLVKMGHKVTTALSAEQGIECFKKEPFDLVILDVVMQNMSGFDCAKKLRSLNHEGWTPIIFLSAAVEDISVSLGIDSGADDYLTKPFSEVMLAAKIKAMQRISDMQKKLFDLTKKLTVLSSTDVLTHTANRGQFEKVLREEISYAHRYHVQFTLFFIDLDHFKDVNDQLGHQAGDLLLIEVAKRINSCLRESDFLGRLGGDEFAIVLKRIEKLDDAGKVAQKILDQLKQPFKLGKNSVNIGCSIGIAGYPIAGSTFEALIQSADIAMYQAKEMGRNNYQYFSKEFNVLHTQRFFLESAIRSEIENKDISICFQPIFEMVTHQLVGMEALIRWKNPKLCCLTPSDFIPIVEKLGLMTQLNNSMMREVSRQASIWKEKYHLNLQLMINLSVHQLMHIELLKIIAHPLTIKNISTALKKQLDSSVLSASMGLEKTYFEMSKWTIGLALESFNIQGSPLNSDPHLLIGIKIDKELMRGATQHPSDALILQSIFTFCQVLELNIFAEGIETKKQLKFLIQNQCKFGQGLLLSPVMTSEEMGLMLEKQGRVNHE
jgi:diguanylate cyclase (GGDEF)-like protein